VGDEEGQAEPEGLQDLQLLDGFLARRRQDAQCAPGKQHEDGCHGSPPEGQGEEGVHAVLACRKRSMVGREDFLNLGVALSVYYYYALASILSALLQLCHESHF